MSSHDVTRRVIEPTARQEFVQKSLRAPRSIRPARVWFRLDLAMRDSLLAQAFETKYSRSHREKLTSFSFSVRLFHLRRVLGKSSNNDSVFTRTTLIDAAANRR